MVKDHSLTGHKYVQLSNVLGIQMHSIWTVAVHYFLKKLVFILDTKFKPATH
jgi:hypothetical protein